jgi:hypothetical protein
MAKELQHIDLTGKARSRCWAPHASSPRNSGNAASPASDACHRAAWPLRAWGPGLRAQRRADEPYFPGGGGQPETLLAVGGEDPVGNVRRHQLCQLTAARAVSPAATLDAAARVVPGHRCQGHRMTAQHLVLSALHRQDIQEPGDADGSKSSLPGGRTASGQPGGTYAPTSPDRSTVTEPAFDTGRACGPAALASQRARQLAGCPGGQRGNRA